MSDIMPIQPINGHRFIPNRIVESLLELVPGYLNKIALMDFTDQERTQFAQLIGYSLSGFADLNYVDDETYAAARKIASSGVSEEVARNSALREQLNEARKGIKVAATALFKIHLDDLEV